MPEDAQVRLKRALHAWRKTYQPLIVTHDLADDQGDPVLKHLRHRGLVNGPDDPVKVVFHPEFVTATSPTIHQSANAGPFDRAFGPSGSRASG